jgi:hypothetical protein
MFLIPILFIVVIGMVITEMIATVRAQSGFYLSDALVVICLVIGLLNSFDWGFVNNG